MNKALTVMVTMALAISISSGAAFVSGGERDRNFVDSNNDGVCDYYVSGSCGRGAGYEDIDGDGVCDNFNIDTSQNGAGSKRGHCGGQGRHGR